METKIYKVDAGMECREIMRKASEVIRRGGLVAFPTETVYGLGADALNPEAARKIYAAKGRPSDNPLIVHIADYEDLAGIAKEVPETAEKLAEAFWPGPLTMIVQKNEKVPYETTGGLDTVAVRMPDHFAALELIRSSGCPIAAPSANASGRPSPTLASHVKEDMDGVIPVILDGGEVGIGIESTIIDLTEEVPMILRPGYITAKMLEAAIGPVRTDPGLASGSDSRPKAPGMKYRHYAPKAELVVIDGDRDVVIDKINELTREMHLKGKTVGIIGTDETAASYGGDLVLSIGARNDEDAIARHLYKILREFDAAGADIIYSESFQTPRIGQAIMNRLLKAAGHQTLAV